MKNRLIPYPFQNNFNALDAPDQLACLNGLMDAHVLAEHKLPKPANMDEWILRVMGACCPFFPTRHSASCFTLLCSPGKGIADLYMRPYNFKVWATPTTMMSMDWLGDKSLTPIDI